MKAVPKSEMASDAYDIPGVVTILRTRHNVTLYVHWPSCFPFRNYSYAAKFSHECNDYYNVKSALVLCACNSSAGNCKAVRDIRVWVSSATTDHLNRPFSQNAALPWQREPLSNSKITILWDCMFPQWWLCKLLTSRKWRRLFFWIDTNVSKERAASVFRVEVWRWTNTIYLPNYMKSHTRIQWLINSSLNDTHSASGFIRYRMRLNVRNGEQVGNLEETAVIFNVMFQ
jgi:hypothetical protein